MESLTEQWLAKGEGRYAFPMTLVKSKTATEKKRIIHGVSSAELPDYQQEKVLQLGMDFSPFLETGYINWDHMDREGGAAYLIGEPIDAKIAPTEEYQHKFAQPLGKGLICFTTAELYNDAGKPKAEQVWQHLEAQDRHPEWRRRLGWSVQGQTLQRSVHDSREICKSVVYQMAITHQPVQRATFAEIAKSMAMSTESAAPLLLENLHGKNEEGNVDALMHVWGPCEEKPCYNSQLKFFQGPRGALEHLVKCRGYTPDSSYMLIAKLRKGGYAF